MCIFNSVRDSAIKPVSRRYSMVLRKENIKISVTAIEGSVRHPRKRPTLLLSSLHDKHNIKSEQITVHTMAHKRPHLQGLMTQRSLDLLVGFSRRPAYFPEGDHSFSDNRIMSCSNGNLRKVQQQRIKTSSISWRSSVRLA